MMNASFLPSTSPQDCAGVFALLSFLADKDACAARLADLTARQQEVEQALAAGAAASDKMAKDMADLAAREQDLADKTRSINNREQAVTARENALTDRETTVTAAESVAAAKADDLAAREAALVSKERDVSDAVAKATSDTAAAAILKSQWQEKVNRAQALLTGA